MAMLVPEVATEGRWRARLALRETEADVAGGVCCMDVQMEEEAPAADARSSSPLAVRFGLPRPPSARDVRTVVS